MAPTVAALDAVSVDVGGLVVGVVVTAIVPTIVYLVKQYVDTQRVRAEMDELRRRVDATAKELQEAKDSLAQLPSRLTRMETLLDLALGSAMKTKVVRDACGYWELREGQREPGRAPGAEE